MECKHCGACCEVNTHIISKSDIKRWKAEGREDILKHVKFIKFSFGGTTSVNTERLKEDKCPFHNENRCLIEDTKPDTL